MSPTTGERSGAEGGRATNAATAFSSGPARRRPGGSRAGCIAAAGASGEERGAAVRTHASPHGPRFDAGPPRCGSNGAPVRLPPRRGSGAPRSAFSAPAHPVRAKRGRPRTPRRGETLRILHTMLRVGDLDRSLAFYTDVLGMKLLRRQDYPDGRFTLAFVGLRSRVRRGRPRAHAQLGHEVLRARQRLRPRRHRGARRARRVRRDPAPRRRRDPRGRSDEARHDRDRVRAGSGRLQDRAHPARLVTGARHAARTGSVTENVVPLPAADATATLPPCARTISPTM